MDNKDVRDGFYDSAAWSRIRARRLRYDKYQCQECRKYGRLIEATEVHHIKHLEDAPELALDFNNLVSLCHKCHNKQHPEKTAKANGGKSFRRYD